jgi:molecular chaperone HscB
VGDPPPTPFEIFGLLPAYAVDQEALQRFLLRTSRIVHPDYYARDPALGPIAERNSALLNGAIAILSDDYLRASWLIEHLGGPTEGAERQMPREFLIEVLEWNEAVEEARQAEPGSAALARLSRLEADLTAERGRIYGEIEQSFDPLPGRGAPALADLRRRLNCIRYLDRALADIASLQRPPARV